MSDWKIGAIELPKAPNKIVNKFPKVIKKIPVLIESPWLFSQGADTFQLTLEGRIFEGSKSLATLNASYVAPFKKYILQPMLIPEVFLDESVTDWESSGTYVFASHTASVIKGDYAIEVRFKNQDGNLMYYFDAPRDFSKHNFISIWQRGANTDKFKISFYNVSGNRTKGYRYYLTMNNNIWTQDFRSFSKSEYSTYLSGTIGTPDGWNSIEAIEITPSDFNPSSQNVFYLFDRFAAGVGFKVETPNNTYDGIYLIRDFQIEEEGGDIESYKYRINLMDTGDYYGEE